MQSRESLKKVIVSFLNLYLDFRRETRNSKTNQIKYALEFGLGKMTGHLPVDDRLDKIVNELRAEALSFMRFDDYYQFIFKLREKAEEAQALKMQSDESVLHATLHGLANIVIKDLLENDEDKEFYKKITSLEELVEDTKKEIRFSNKDRQGKNVPELNKILKETVWRLAQLGEVDCISMAIRYNMLDYLKIPDITEISDLNYTSANYAAPLQLQREFGEKYYAYRYQKFTNIDYRRFKEYAIEKPLEKLEEKIPQGKEPLKTDEQASISDVQGNIPEVKDESKTKSEVQITPDIQLSVTNPSPVLQSSPVTPIMGKAGVFKTVNKRKDKELERGQENIKTMDHRS